MSRRLVECGGGERSLPAVACFMMAADILIVSVALPTIGA
jgi:hypothetical protein